MSGIIGVWNSRNTPWQQMLESLKVLGQDGIGDWHDSIGLSLGRAQFFNTPESRLEPPVIKYRGCVLVWDGRIDDRDSLISDSSDSTTDGELLIESYRRWGINCLEHLIGEYAFILWDATEDLLFVGCDVVGGRTIGYFWDDRTLLLSSRLVSLLHHPQVSKELDRLYLAHTLNCSAYHPPGITPFKDLKRLRPGHALILKSGQLQERKVASLNITHPRSPKNPEGEYEQFWDLLDSAVKDRLRSDRSVCTTISGGLDSTTVTVSLLKQLPSIDAFSNVTTVFPEFDERKPIQSFLAAYPQIEWHDINGDRAWVFSEPWDKLPVPDDPLVATTLAMDLQLMASMQQQGFGRVFDGDWGDDIFYSDLQGLLRSGSWVQAKNYLHGSFKSTLFNELVLPALPNHLQQQWFKRWQHRSNPIPPWMNREYENCDRTQLAIQQYYQSSLSNSLEHSIALKRESGYCVGALGVYKLMKNFHGLEATSPMQDRRLLEFALNLHPSLQYDTRYNKIFLRQAGIQTLPKDILWRPKVNWFDPLKYIGLAKGQQPLNLLDNIKQIPIFAELIDLSKLESYLHDYRKNYLTDYQPQRSYCQMISNQFFKLIYYVNWYKYVIKI